ncbi:Outer membrane receptor proteins, mostly Fe transport [Flavobacterium omnivorum]|uniref:Outer membrane receptor proteins, mostly Fe transport n=1 Tax=Flavobacterium omnivorum TaxID=178355 RepID=A0A1G7VUQ5_9FLAO|nr:TonB-dependent receptor [Flavobacterium omnivorum]SDG63534.1 Outer membrane receptor proteins, mostly Fe transport [Flavobacterium omnivorum]
MKFKLLFFTLLLTAVSFSQNKGTITGTLTDKDDNNQSLPFANVLLKGTSIGTNTDIDGKYTLKVLPGSYTLQFSFVGYESVEIPVTVIANETITVSKALGSAGYKLEDVVVRSTVSREKETALLLDQKQAVVIKQSIGSQEMARKGVSDVEEGLTKITGITKVDGRGLFIRGLEDRYNNLLINDLQSPSNSPFKKIIPLDLFPTDVVGVLNVYKTFNPNISGDFAGATVNIETPQPKNITKLNIGFGYTTNNNLEAFLLADDANSTKGTLGMLGNDRALPSAFGAVPNGVELSPSEYENGFGKKSWDVNNTKSPLNSSIGFLHAQKFNLKNESNISYIMSFNFDNKYSYREGVDRTFNLGQSNYDNNLYNKQYSYQTTFSGLAGLKYKTNRFNLNFNTFLIKATDSKIQDQIGYVNSGANITDNLIRMNQYEESKYWNTQLFGDYKLTEDGKHSLKAGGSYVKTSFQQPDRKFITGRVNNDQIEMIYGGNNLNRQYLDVKGNFYYSSLLEYNLKFGDQEESNLLSIGYNSSLNDMQSTYRFFSGKSRTNTQPYNANVNTISENINQDINNGIVYVKEESNGDYKVKLNQFVNAGYFNLFMNFGEKWDLNAGIRAESSTREIKYREQGDPFGSAYRKKTDDKLDILPSVNAKRILNDNSNLRLSLAKTITRPVAVELLPINYINADGTSESGNKDLKDSENYNVDFKYELFPNNKEMFAVGVFGKMINNPIERVFKPTANSGGQITTFKNSEQAVIYGAEIEMLLQLSRINESLSNFSLGFNTSLMSTDVKIDLKKQGNELENSTNRKLQGASSWLINSDLKYDFILNKDWKNSMTLVYNVYGDRIFAVGSSGIDHIYEKSFSKLDFVWTNSISKSIELKFGIDNILNPSYKKELGSKSTLNITEDSLILREFKKGVGFSFNIGYTF